MSAGPAPRLPVPACSNVFQAVEHVPNRGTSTQVSPLTSPCSMFHTYIDMEHGTTPTATPPLKSEASVGSNRRYDNAILKPSEATKSAYRGLSILKPSPAVADLLDYLPGRYAPYRSTLWSNVRHHCVGGRTESERFMDRRSWGEFENRAIRRMQGAPLSEEDISTFAPSKRKIYPARATRKDTVKYTGSRKCSWCGFAFKGRKDAVFCGDSCRKASKRAAKRAPAIVGAA